MEAFQQKGKEECPRDSQHKTSIYVQISTASYYGENPFTFTGFINFPMRRVHLDTDLVIHDNNIFFQKKIKSKVQ